MRVFHYSLRFALLLVALTWCSGCASIIVQGQVRSLCPKGSANQIIHSLAETTEGDLEIRIQPFEGRGIRGAPDQVKKARAQLPLGDRDHCIVIPRASLLNRSETLEAFQIVVYPGPSLVQVRLRANGKTTIDPLPIRVLTEPNSDSAPCDRIGGLARYLKQEEPGVITSVGTEGFLVTCQGAGGAGGLFWNVMSIPAGLFDIATAPIQVPVFLFFASR